MKYLPYQGRLESHDAWVRRCDEFEERRARENKWRNAGRGSQKFDGERLPESCTDSSEVYILRCRSKMNATEKWLDDNVNTLDPYVGVVVGHSLASSYVYTTVPKKLYDAAKEFFRGKKIPTGLENRHSLALEFIDIFESRMDSE